MSLYFNDNDPYLVQWTSNLWPTSTGDTRSIADVQPEDVGSHTRAHFFSGIGGWEYALQLAGWDMDEQVWTGSCPCQPFSTAGKRQGVTDARHLWPEFRRLIAECHPTTVFGEQVASKDGRLWLAGVRADLEALGYAVGCADLCAAGIGAPHIRQRLYWVAHTPDVRRVERGPGSGAQVQGDSTERTGKYPQPGVEGQLSGGLEGLRDAGGVAYSECTTSSRLGRISLPLESQQEAGRSSEPNAWSDSYLIECADGRARRSGTGVFPLAYGVSGRVGRIRAYGNAIVSPLAAEFVRAFMEARDE